jgi:alpha-beta hydrolase superfamily lysophospholipase
MRAFDLEFASTDGIRLAGTLHTPDRLPCPLVIGCHGLLSDRRSPKQIALAEACCTAGIAFFRFDHRGCGDSDGSLERDTSLEARCRDLTGAMDHMAGRADLGRPFGLFGSSMGGAVCLATASRRDVGPIVTFAAPVRSGPLLAAATAKGVPPDMQRMAEVLGEPFDLASALPRIRRLLVVHGDSDRVVPAAHAHEIHAGAGAPKRLVIQPGGDHLMSNPHHQGEFLCIALEWFLERA